LIDQTTVYIFMFFLVAVPGLYFITKSALFNRYPPEQFEDEDGNIRHVDISKTVSTLNSGVGLLHDRDPLLVDSDIRQAVLAIEAALPRFQFCGAGWRIVNIDGGSPTTISANIPCLDQRDPDVTIRMDLGLLITVEDHFSGNKTVVKLRFIPYEGPHGTLEELADLTEKFLAKALLDPQAVAQVAAPVAPQAVQVAFPEEPEQQMFQNEFKDDAALEYQQSASAKQAEAAYGAFKETVEEANAPLPGFSASISESLATPAPVVAPSTPTAASIPAPPTPPAPVSAPVSTPVSIPAAAVSFTDFETSLPGFELPAAPITLPAAELPASGPVTPATPSTPDAKPGLCPGCSQPINPSFPFCLYCSRNF
jgi:hypothetical protein